MVPEKPTNHPAHPDIARIFMEPAVPMQLDDTESPQRHGKLELGSL
jgi:hypothetical protein